MAEHRQALRLTLLSAALLSLGACMHGPHHRGGCVDGAGGYHGHQGGYHAPLCQPSGTY